MVKLPIVKAANLKLIESQPLVAVFIGGTSGIGEFTIRTLAATHSTKGKGLRVYIVGRNIAAAEKTIAECRSTCPNGQFIFVQVQDLSLLKNVDVASAEITRLESEASGGKPRIDLLVMTQANFLLTFAPRQETPEGLDSYFSQLYYSRMRFIVSFLPLLLASSLPARVVSVYAAGTESKLITDDISLRKPGNYVYSTLRSHAVHMQMLFMEKLAKQYPGKLSFSHIFPGLIVHGGFDDPRLPWWFKLIWRLTPSVLINMVATSGEECGQRILFLATDRYPARGDASDENADVAVGFDGVKGSGIYEINSDSETIDTRKAYDKLPSDFSETVWKHTISAFEEIEAGKVFTG